jgi:hypothetical protein
MAGRARFRAEPGDAPDRPVFRDRLEGRQQTGACQNEARRPLPIAVAVGRASLAPGFESTHHSITFAQRLLIVNLLRLTPSSTPVPLPVSDSDTSPLVRACASDDWPAPAAAPALA